MGFERRFIVSTYKTLVPSRQTHIRAQTAVLIAELLNERFAHKNKPVRETAHGNARMTLPTILVRRLPSPVKRGWSADELRIQVVPHALVTGDNKKDQIMELHNQYVAEGWEGCVARDVSKPYKYGGRGQEMVKFKMYQDAEFEITGISEGLREEDMCFTLITEDGIEFKAKPMGSRELKQQYREDLDKLIGKMATVKFFYLSDEGTPLQPVLKAIRDYD